MSKELFDKAYYYIRKHLDFTGMNVRLPDGRVASISQHGTVIKLHNLKEHTVQVISYEYSDKCTDEELRSIIECASSVKKLSPYDIANNLVQSFIEIQPEDMAGTSMVDFLKRTIPRELLNTITKELNIELGGSYSWAPSALF